MLDIFGWGGDSYMAPGHTMESFWAGIGGGANGIVIAVRRSKDDEVYCFNHEKYQVNGGVGSTIEDLAREEIDKLDAGATFISRGLSGESYSNLVVGKDNPWSAEISKNRVVRIPLLEHVLTMFGRRTRVLILLPGFEQKLIELTVDILQKLGLAKRVTLIGDERSCKFISEKVQEVPLSLSVDGSINRKEWLEYANRHNVRSLTISIDLINSFMEEVGESNDRFADNSSRKNLTYLLRSDKLLSDTDIDRLRLFKKHYEVEGLISPCVLETVKRLFPPAIVLADDFNGKEINTSIWSAGYSRVNTDTKLYQDDGLRIEICEGGEYSGGAAICKIPLHGDFDTQVDFYAKHATQGSTFELAAICIDPGYHNTDTKNLDKKKVNLTFDVHGAPPYASSERDEDNGFRCGWNNSFNLTAVSFDWEAFSFNMYNKYGRNVGDGSEENTNGSLRLVRSGSVFVSYYKDRSNESWVCSGVMLVQNMADDVYIRLAAKHWPKKGKKPPQNEVVFSNFRVYQH